MHALKNFLDQRSTDHPENIQHVKATTTGNSIHRRLRPVAGVGIYDQVRGGPVAGVSIADQVRGGPVAGVGIDAQVRGGPVHDRRCAR